MRPTTRRALDFAGGRVVYTNMWAPYLRCHMKGRKASCARREGGGRGRGRSEKHPHGTQAPRPGGGGGMGGCGRRLPRISPATLHRASQPVTYSSLRNQTGHVVLGSTMLTCTPIPQQYPAHCGCLEDGGGVGNGTFFRLRRKPSLGPSVLGGALGEGYDEGGH